MERDAVANRQLWQSQREPAAIRWLLASQIRNGMTVDEVNQRIGDNAEKEPNSREFKREGDGYRADDEFYRYGPDRDGEVYYLGFRDDRLINFNSENYKN